MKYKNGFSEQKDCDIYKQRPFMSIKHISSTPAQYIFHVYLVVNINRELKFKMVVTVGLQDISHTGILICFHFIRLLFKN